MSASVASQTIVVALGGNALGNTASEQQNLVAIAATALADLVEEGHRIVVTHGNGPQVGAIKTVMDTSTAADPTFGFPFPECGAMSQGYIGYHLQQGIANELRRRGIDRPVASLVTQVVVDADDSAFKNPTKPIGIFYSREEAEQLAAQTGNVYVEDSGRGWRWAVASPRPTRIVEAPVIDTLVRGGAVVICSGGGGVPVVEDTVGLRGVPAVIDKDRSGALLATQVQADVFLILTAVEKVAINFNTLQQSDLDTMTVDEARMHMAAGEFGAGSMHPKVEACVEFLQQCPDATAIITSLEQAKAALAGMAGTVITA